MRFQKIAALAERRNNWREGNDIQGKIREI